jgi:hypothetical protein
VNRRIFLNRLLAALDMVFPKAAASTKDLQGRFVPALKRLAQRLGRRVGLGWKGEGSEPQTSRRAAQATQIR